MGNAGVLVAAGLIAGEALMGLVIATFAFFDIQLPALFENPNWLLGIAFLALVGIIMILVPLSKAGRPDEEAPPMAVM